MTSRQLMTVMMVAACTVLMTWAAHAAVENLLPDPGFEAVGDDGQLASWMLTAGEPGALNVAADETEVHSGARAAHITAAPKDDRNYARLRSDHVRPVWGARYRGSVWLKGTGAAKVGITQQFRIRRSGDQEFADTWSEPVTLTDDWQQLTVEESLLADREVARVWLSVEVEGDGAEAYADDGSLVISRQVTVTPPYAMVREGDSFEFQVALAEEGEPVTQGALTVVTRNGEDTSQAELPLAGATTAYAFTAPATPEQRVFRLDFQNDELRVRQPVFLHVVDAETYAKFEQAAANTKLATPAHLLMIGDSLSDVDRAHNWTDVVAFWLWKTHDGQVTYRNAGVGGDFITRTWGRLEGEDNAYRLYMYDDLYDPMPTQVLIFLGHNDSKLSPKPEYKSPDDYTDPVVSYENWDKYMRMAIEKFKADTGAQVIVMSNTSSVYEVCAERVIKNIAAGKSGGSLFGKPEVMERFNAIARQFAAEEGARFVDVYTPTFEHPDKPSLFYPDGVHINQEGNWLVAQVVLESFQE